MKNKNNFFTEQTTETHDQKVISAAHAELKSISSSKTTMWKNWKILLTGFAVGSAALVLTWFNSQNQADSDSDLLSMHEALSENDLDFFADQDLDWELMEDLDLLEDWEET